MKKVLLVSLAAALIILSVGCAKQTEAPKGDIKVEDSQPKQNAEPAKSTEVSKPAEQKAVNSNTYTNSKYGYSIDFPKEWLGIYKVVDVKTVDGDGFLEVDYLGKSKAGKEGMRMFYIVEKKILDKGFFDSQRKLGTVKGKEYYYATPTDTALGLVDINNTEVKDKKELELMKYDFNKFQAMEKEVDGILKTFRAN